MAQADATPEATKEADDRIHETKKLLARVRASHLADLRRDELESVRELFDRGARELAKPSEENAFDSLLATAEREIEKPSFDSYIGELRSKIFTILWRQDWFVIDQFNHLAERPYLFPDSAEFAGLVKTGEEAIEANDVDRLRQIVAELSIRRIGSSSEAELLQSVNVLRGR